jgi:hypothetical protein
MEVSRVERQQLLKSMRHHQRRQARVMGSLSGDLAAVDKFEPTIQNIGSLGKEWELIA